LDSSWIGYKVIAMPSYQGTNMTLMDFDLPDPGRQGSADPSQEDYSTAFIMIAVPTTSWRVMLPLGGPSDYISVPTFIGSTADDIFGFSYSDAPPQMASYQCEVKRVLETFEPISRVR
jgi:hypothetical protein